MKVALCVSVVSSDIEKTKTGVLDNIHEAKIHGSDLIVFPESCVTGLVNSGNPADDIDYAMLPDDKFLLEIEELAFQSSMLVSIGFLEKTFDGALYDSLLFVDGKAKRRYVYRRIDEGWKTRNSDSEIYRVGETITFAETEIGTIALIICGDLFNERVMNQLKSGKPFDYLIHPLICHDRWMGQPVTQAVWDQVLTEYTTRISSLQCTSFMVNLLGRDNRGNNAFGGAWVLSPEGNVLARKRIGEPGILYYEVN